MKQLFTTITLCSILLMLGNVAHAQNCTDGSTAEIQVLNLTGVVSFDDQGAAGNTTGTVTFSAQQDVVA